MRYMEDTAARQGRRHGCSNALAAAYPYAIDPLIQEWCRGIRSAALGAAPLQENTGALVPSTGSPVVTHAPDAILRAHG